MAVTRKTERLAHGQLPVAKTTLYTCPPDTRVSVTCISLVNTDVVARTVNLYLKASGGSSKNITPKDMIINASDQYLAIMLSFAMHPNDVIEGDASVVTKIDYVLSGEVY